MISTLKRIRDQRAAQESNGGFTLIELLIVIVVLGILAAVVVFSLGSVTSKSAVAACQADGATVNTAMAAYNANLGSNATAIADLTGTSVSGGPYLQSWPNNINHYLFGLSSTGKLYVAISGTTAAVGTSPWVLWQGSATCATSAGTGTPAIPSVATVK